MHPHTSPSFYSDGKEHRVFLAMLRMIPGLQTRLLSSSDEELRIIADLVCPISESQPASSLYHYPDSERRLECKIRRHQEPEKCHY